MGVNVRVCQEYSRKDSNYKWKIIPINKLKPADAKKPGFNLFIGIIFHL